MKRARIFFAVLLILHGLAHASAGAWASAVGGRALVPILWELATLGFISAGAGLLGVRWLRSRWRPIAIVAVLSSAALLLLFSHPLFNVGIAADIVIVVIVLAPSLGGAFDPPSARRLTTFTFVAFILYVATIIAIRPWHSSWGSTRSERLAVLIGDPPIGESHYRIDHAITIRAPADSIWPWIAQIGQDRAGFYTYDWLERAFGADIRNVNRIVPEWQQLEPGDFVRAVQPNYLGGVFGRNLGWSVTQVEPGRGMVLRKWGAFVVEPVDSMSARLHIRTRGRGVPTLAGIPMTPIALLILEPAHFIMERGMMLGIKKRAERL